MILVREVMVILEGEEKSLEPNCLGGREWARDQQKL